MEKVGRTNHQEPGILQAFHELIVIETILLRMIEQMPPERMGYVSLQDFFTVESPAGLENTMYFPKRITPVGDVVYNAEIEHRVVIIIFRRNVGYIPYPKSYPVAVPF